MKTKIKVYPEQSPYVKGNLRRQISRMLYFKRDIEKVVECLREP